MKTVKISEIFPSIAGEGRFVGKPVLFVRFSGCTRNCKYCDSKYHAKGTEVSITYLQQKIREYKGDTICFTGGEPLLQIDVIEELNSKFRFSKGFHLETNADLLEEYMFNYFDYICTSPKEKKIAKKVADLIYDDFAADIKVVTDLKTVGLDMLQYATMIMPLTTNNKEESKQITQNVWEYCVKNSKNFCPRLHYYVWGRKRGV